SGCLLLKSFCKPAASNGLFTKSISQYFLVAERGGLRYRDPQGGGDNKKILPRSARDLFCSSPYVSLRLSTDSSHNPSHSIFLLRIDWASNPRSTSVYVSF